jgi:hypothetical protein
VGFETGVDPGGGFLRALEERTEAEAARGEVDQDPESERMNDGGIYGIDAGMVLDRIDSADTPLTLISFISLIGRFFSVTGVFSIMSSVESAPSITLRGVRD